MLLLVAFMFITTVMGPKIFSVFWMLVAEASLAKPGVTIIVWTTTIIFIIVI